MNREKLARSIAEAAREFVQENPFGGEFHDRHPEQYERRLASVILPLLPEGRARKPTTAAKEINWANVRCLNCTQQVYCIRGGQWFHESTRSAGCQMYGNFKAIPDLREFFASPEAPAPWCSCGDGGCTPCAELAESEAREYELSVTTCRASGNVWGADHDEQSARTLRKFAELLRRKSALPPAPEGGDAPLNPFSKGYKHRHGEPVSDACGDGRHNDCDQDFTKCHCTWRGGHTKARHCYSAPGERFGDPRAPPPGARGGTATEKERKNVRAT